MKKTYKDFGEALDILRVEHELSYDRLALGLGIANSYVYHMINRRTKNAPSNEIIEKVANYFTLEPEYFFEYRLRKMLDYVKKDRKFLDHCERALRKYELEDAKKERSSPAEDTDNSNADEQTA